MIKIEKLNKVYENGYEALKSVDLEVPKGALMSLLGPSGCGKSTILNIVAGLLDPTKGDIKFDGESVINKHPKDRDIGMVFQNYALYPHMSVLENVIFPLTVGSNKIKKQEAVKIAQKYIDLTDISDIKDKKPKALSGGQQQRVAIARALVQNPKILLLDEPLSNLDARLRIKIREEIRSIVKKLGVTTVFVTHDQEEALSISDYIALMDKGIIQQVDIPQNLYLNPSNLFVAKFIGTPIINTYKASFDGNSLITKDFSIKLSELENSRFREEFKSGEDYTLAIRPEHLKISEGGIPVEVISIEMIGRYMIVHFDLDNEKSRLLVDSNILINEGDRINLSIDYPSIYIFDKDDRRVY
ncbi:ABC transporter ATP-binding protein [Anaerococcus sp. AGMB00486]|uniref:ABC transporter ATP-binding protein n=1 Tax=Anaerococcus faecalis TaxID=2742993 RepID=A0ABX2NA16_9FIRM|nr:ABC transporter ATP-binding protein [Anaerococcus faecalis]NVF11499.1 ABC transporter ATP-binding protein [Anaerococcus faecalis]